MMVRMSRLRHEIIPNIATVSLLTVRMEPNKKCNKSTFEPEMEIINTPAAKLSK